MALVAKAKGTHEQENLLTVVRVWEVKHSDTRDCNKSAERTYHCGWEDLTWCCECCSTLGKVDTLRQHAKRG